MNNLTFAQLCAEFAAATNEITRLTGILPQFRSDEHPYVLDQQKARRDAVRAEMRRRWEDER